jgi:hypothetical protein
LKKIILLFLLFIPVVLFADFGEIRIVSEYDTVVGSDSLDAVVSLGDTFTLQIWVNPNSIPVNAVSVFLTYDTNYLLLLDTDENNEWTADTNIREHRTNFGDILENREPLLGRISYSALTNEDYFSEETLIAEMVFLAYDTTPENTLINYEFKSEKNRETALVSSDSFISIISASVVTPGKIRIIAPEERTQIDTDLITGAVNEIQQILFQNVPNIVRAEISNQQRIEIFYPSFVLNNSEDTVIISTVDANLEPYQINEPGFKSIGRIFKIYHTSGQRNFLKNLDWILKIPVNAVSNPNNLLVKYSETDFSSDKNNWNSIDGVSKTIINDNIQLSFSLDHLTFFCVIDTSPPTNLANVRVYPNPFVPGTNSSSGRQWRLGDYETGIIFDFLTAGSKVFIYSVTGQLVASSQSLGAAESRFHWDARNDDDMDVASGIYIYVVKDNVGNVKTGKLGIVR